MFALDKYRDTYWHIIRECERLNYRLELGVKLHGTVIYEIAGD